MKTIIDILQRAGGWHPGLYLKITNPPHKELVIEALGDTGPCGLPALSVCSYSVVGGDLVRNPEMCFEVDVEGGVHLTIFYYRSDLLGVEQWSRFIREGVSCVLPQRYQQQKELAQLWDDALAQQKFAEVFDSGRHIVTDP